MKKRRSIRAYLWLLALVVLIPAGGMLAYSILSDARYAQREVQATTLSLAQLVASQTQRLMDDTENVAGKLARRPGLRALDPYNPVPVLDQFLPLHPQFANAVFCDAQGRVIRSAVPGPPGRPLEGMRAEWMKAVLRDKRFSVGKPKLGDITGRWVCVMAYPVLNEAGEIGGAVGLSVDLERFQPAINFSSLPPGSVVCIMDNEGTVISRSLEPQLWVGKDMRKVELIKTVLEDFEGSKTARGLDDEERIYSFTTIPKVGWHVVVGIPTQSAFAAVRASATGAAILGAGLFGIIVVMVLLVAGRIDRPVKALFDAANAAATGAEFKLPDSGPGEIVAVAEQFKSMFTARQQEQANVTKLNAELENRVHQRTAELEQANTELQREVSDRKRAEEALRAHRQELQDYIDGMSTMSAKVALDGTFLLVNKTARQAFGLAADQLMKTNFLEGKWWAFEPEVQERVRVAFGRACEGTPVNYVEKIFVFGRAVQINFSLVPVHGANGEVSYVVAEGRDVTALKVAEMALESRTRDLEAANRELEAFCYSVSHDLRAPLRTIGGFSKMLLEEHGRDLQPNAREWLDRIRSGVSRMMELTDDLLELSRVSRGQLVCRDVDLSILATTITNELRASDPGREAVVSIEPGLHAHGDTGLLQLVMANLLGNAWKFSRSRKPAHIEFGVAKTNGSSAFFVRDDGVGFDMKYAEKLFGAFQRLHSSSEYEGHGIGLATVQRIIRRHGGTTWGEARPNEGAVFYFTLPSTTAHSSSPAEEPKGAIGL
jgi:PAS domain S-box-containing protein